jgi:fructoselysine-6-P-deglycase FrlB-like protein/predicted TIM-barrel fold metal-dependent hydrolase
MSDPLTVLCAKDPDAFTPREILRQPWLWRETARRVAAFQESATRVLKDFDVLTPGTVPDGFAVFSGAGSSHYVGRMVEDVLRPSLGIASSAVSATDLVVAPEAYLPRDRRGVMFSFSRSGESPEVVEAARRVAEQFPRVAHIVVTCNSKGTLMREFSQRSEHLSVALHEATCDRGLSMTSSFTSMVLAGRFLAAPFQGEAFARRVEALAQAAEGLLKGHSATAEAVAARGPERIVVLGTGPLGGASLEGGLKILELTDGEVAVLPSGFLEVRHGPLSFLTKKTTLLCFLSSEPHIRRYELDLMRQVRRSGTYLEIIALVQGKDAEVSAAADRAIELPQMGDGDAGVLYVVFAQMVGLFLSIRHGLRPDQPSNRGLIHRVVQGVQIHPRPPLTRRNPVMEELSRRGGPTLALKDYRPTPMLRRPEHFPLRPRFPVIDLHNHIDGDDPRRLLALMDECGVAKIVDLSAAVGEEAKRVLDSFLSVDAGRFGVMATPDWSGVHQKDFAAREADRLRDLLRRGACGIKIFKALGLTVRDKEGRLLRVDDALLDPIWEVAQEAKKPVAIHTGDPMAFFHPADRFNERYEELAAHPDWGWQGRDVPSWEDLWAGQCRLFEKFPGVSFIAVHVGGAPEDLDRVGQMLDRYPNVAIDLAARLAELGRQPYRAREFLIRYADRACFGTDLPPHVEMYRQHYRMFETQDEYIDYPSHASRQGRWKVYGLGLPEEVLRRIYSTNAKRIIGSDP